MADPTSLDIKKLNQTVESALKMLESRFGSSAESKATQAKQRQAIEKFFEGSKNMEESLAKMGDDLEEWAEANKDMRVGIKGFFQSIQDWKKSVMEQRTALGHTFRFMAATWKATGEKLFSVVRNAFSTLKQHVMEVLGPVGDVFMLMKDFLLAPFKFLGGLISQWWKSTPPGDKKRNKFLKELVMFERIKAKKDLLGLKSKKKQGLGLPVWAIGIIAAIAAVVFLGEEIMKVVRAFSALKISVGIVGAKIGGVRGFFMRIIKFIAKFEKGKKWLAGKVGPFMKSGGTLDKFLGFFSGLGRWFVKLASMSRIFRVALTALRVGMKIFGWPLQIIIAMFDFYKGWTSTEGDLLDKLQGGMKQVIKGFLGAFIDLFGWIIEKLLGAFGIDASGFTDWMHEWLDRVLDILGMPLRTIVNFFKAVFGGKGTFKQRLMRGMLVLYKGMADMFNAVIDYMTSLFSWIPGVSKLEGFKIDTGGTSPVSNVTGKESSINNKREAEKRKDWNDKERREKRKEKMDSAKREQDRLQTMGFSSVSQGGGGTGGDIRQVPDEVDNAYIGMGLWNEGF